MIKYFFLIIIINSTCVFSQKHELSLLLGEPFNSKSSLNYFNNTNDSQIEKVRSLNFLKLGYSFTTPKNIVFNLGINIPFTSKNVIRSSTFVATKLVEEVCIKSIYTSAHFAFGKKYDFEKFSFQTLVGYQNRYNSQYKFSGERYEIESNRKEVIANLKYIKNKGNKSFENIFYVQPSLFYKIANKLEIGCNIGIGANYIVYPKIQESMYMVYKTTGFEQLLLERNTPNNTAFIRYFYPELILKYSL